MKELHCLVLVSKWDMVLINLKIFIKAALSTSNSQIRTPIFYSEVFNWSLCENYLKLC